ncbi:hypothetical protein RUM43_006209 [Polyplax serrata]|uniref:Uncharacterized protein n=1 Tax=Polyplax serrata TaxID=468196 RepID=A0AAN8PCA9_POLSC
MMHSMARSLETVETDEMIKEDEEYKRRSRDIETETDEELLLYQVSLDSSGSFSSSVSLSDKSVSTDNNVEEYIGDVPFAGESSIMYCYLFIIICRDR